MLSEIICLGAQGLECVRRITEDVKAEIQPLTTFQKLDLMKRKDVLESKHVILLGTYGDFTRTRK